MFFSSGKTNFRIDKTSFDKNTQTFHKRISLFALSSLGGISYKKKAFPPFLFLGVYLKKKWFLERKVFFNLLSVLQKVNFLVPPKKKGNWLKKPLLKNEGLRRANELYFSQS
jgi:hypothetical protein